MPFPIPWSELNHIEIFVLIILLAGMFLAARILKTFVDQSGRENAQTHQVMRDSIQRQERTASKQQAVCAENVSLNKDTNQSVRSQNHAILEMLHGARIGLAQASIDDDPRRQIEERLGEAERIIREAG